ncbi:sugar ABC transporter ATP-binding protein [Treponema primitia]|uniref:sugar ABC transporter ATP-binding protein n=1 Tax=Treponema primitia TaxID=88058 RepID=UPI00397ED8C7
MGTDRNSEILSIRRVCKYFPGVRALNDVSIDVKRGSVHGIVGENGAGKSTLMKILSGIHQKDAGEIYFDGEKIETTTPVQSLHRGLSIIYQEFNLVNTMSIGENIFLGRFREMGGMKGTHRAAGKLLESLGSRLDTWTLVSELSTSEKQMVEICKALAFDSKLVIMDEPSSSLTAEEMKKLRSLISEMRKRGISVIYISHKLDEIFEFCDMVTIMRDGSVIDTKPIGNLTRNDMIAKMIGRSIDKEFPERPRCVGEPLLEVRSLNTKKLHDISFTLNKGEILGLVGLVGAGRTELIRAVFGADRVKEKEIYLRGVKTPIRSPKDAIRAGLALVPEDRKSQGLVLSFSVESNISMASLGRLSKHGFLSRAKERKLAEKEIEQLNIKTPSASVRVLNLSGGNQQKCVIGRWLETNPEILILDEPTRGIDVGAKYEIYLLMKKIVERGGSILMISSELPEVLSMSNRVLTVCGGRITGEFNPEQVPAEAIIEKAIG